VWYDPGLKKRVEYRRKAFNNQGLIPAAPPPEEEMKGKLILLTKHKK
jgi:hypothetical protein